MTVNRVDPREVDLREVGPLANPTTTPTSGLVEVDLRLYLESLFAWWREIILSVFLVAIIGATIAIADKLLSEDRFETSADIVMERVVSDVNMVETFRTTTNESGPAANAIARREALVHLVRSGEIAEAVIMDLGAQLNEDEQQPAVLLSMIRAEAPVGTDGRTASDLIRITVNADSPDKAAAIANSWARHYVAHINNVYNQVPIEIFASVEAELQAATATYQAAQSALESFIAENNIDELQYRINHLIGLRTNYETAQSTLAISLIEQDRAARQKIFNDLVIIQNEALYSVFDQDARQHLNELSRFYALHNQAQAQLRQAQNLRAQIAGSDVPTSSGTMLALQLLKTQVYGTINDSSLPAGLTIELGDALTTTNEEPLNDVETLIGTLESYVVQLNEQINTLSVQLLAGEGYNFTEEYTPENLLIAATALPAPATMTATVSGATEASVTEASAAGSVPNGLSASIYARYRDLFEVGELARLAQANASAASDTDIATMINDLNREIQTLRAELAAQESEQQVVTQNRDLAWNTYNTMQNKIVELTLARTAPNSEVRLGSQAVAPRRPLPGQELPVVVGVAAVVGFMLAILGVTVAHVMGKAPLLAGRRAA